jgi:hypothetical protein
MRKSEFIWRSMPWIQLPGWLSVAEILRLANNNERQLVLAGSFHPPVSR